MNIQNLVLKVSVMLFVIFSNVYLAQNLVWAKQLAGTGSNSGRSIAVDGSGNVYTCGSFAGTVDFDPGIGTFSLTSVGAEDIYISKLNSSGNFVWAKSMGSTFSDAAYGITTDASDNVLFTGSFLGTVDFDPNPGTFTLSSAGGTYDIFISKLDPSGNLLWANAIGSTDSDHGFAIVTDAAGNVFTTGYYNLTVDFDPGPGTNLLTGLGNDDIFVLKLNSAGAFVWARSLGGTLVDAAYAIVLDGGGNVFTTGYFSGTSDFDPGAGTYTISSNGSYDIFISKLNSSGNFVWANSIGGVGNDEGHGISADLSGNILFTGYYEGIVDFDPGVGFNNLTSNGSSDIFITKLNSAGSFLWAQSVGSTGNDDGKGIVTDNNGHVFATGYFSGLVDFNPGIGTYTLNSAGTDDVFISRFDANGNFIWAKNLGGSLSDVGYAIVRGSGWDILTTGSFNGIADFDPNVGTFTLSSAGSDDAYIHKMCQVPLTPGAISGSTLVCSGSVNNYSMAFVSGATSYTWNLPVGWTGSSGANTIAATPGSSGIFTISATNACGIGPLVNLSVTVNSSPTLTVSNNFSMCVGQSTVLTVSGANSYTWSTGSLTNIATVSPTITTNYTVTGTSSVTGCSSTLTLNLVVVNCVGIKNFNSSLNGLLVYPNPTADEFTIEIKNKFENKIEVCDLMGKIIYEIKSVNNKISISLKDLREGIYFVKISSDDSSEVLKVVKQ